jgi:hypothetical protein
MEEPPHNDDISLQELVDNLEGWSNEGILELKAKGLPIVYRDDDGIDILEEADGRRFHIRYQPDHSYIILGELAPYL